MAIETKVVGLDVAKNVFQVHGVDRRGETVLRKRLRRSQVAEFFRHQAPYYRNGWRLLATRNLIGRVPKFKLLTEHGRRLRLDDHAEQKLLVAKARAIGRLACSSCCGTSSSLRGTRNAEPARALPHSRGELRLEQPNYLCAGQQDG